MQPLPDIPPELFARVFRWVEPQDLTSIALVCKDWHELTLSNSLWKHLCTRDWDIKDQDNSPDDHRAWREVYIEHYYVYNKYKEPILLSLEDFRNALSKSGGPSSLPWTNIYDKKFSDNDMDVQSVHYLCKRTNKIVYALKVKGIISVPKCAAEVIVLDLGLNKKWDKTLLVAKVQKRLNSQSDILVLRYKNLRMICARTISDFINTRQIVTHSITREFSEDLEEFYYAKRQQENSSKSLDDNNNINDSNNNNNNNDNHKNINNNNNNSPRIHHDDSPYDVDETLIMRGITKRGSGFSITGVDPEHSEVTYLLQLEEGEWVNENAIHWMTLARWNTVLNIRQFYETEYSRMDLNHEQHQNPNHHFDGEEKKILKRSFSSMDSVSPD